MEHTFQVGDRVICIGRVMQSMANREERGTVVEVKGHGVEVQMDRGELNRLDGTWFFYWNEVSHDRDLNVGDWVRYEGRNGLAVSSKEGQVGMITSINNRGYVSARGIHGNVDKDSQPTSDQGNLVKIQPPKEENVEQVTIEHDQWGKEQCMRLFCGGENKCWEKRVDGRLVRCFSNEGWREVPKTKLVPVLHRITCERGRHVLMLEGWLFELPKGYRWKSVEIEKEVENG